MKTFKSFLLAIFALSLSSLIHGQNADEIINKYINAIGSQELINKVSSVYMEGTIDAMGNQGNLKISVLNGKGYKQDVDVMGTKVVMCYTDSMGWQINPMTGNYSAEIMPADQYNSGRDQIYVAGPLASDYLAKGYKAELVGLETVGTASANKIKITAPDNTETMYYFDATSNLLIKMVLNGQMMGQTTEITTNFSNYQKPENGFSMPYTIEMNFGGQFSLTSNITSVTVNPAIDPAIFLKP